jgi:hypothetical protein
MKAVLWELTQRGTSLSARPTQGCTQKLKQSSLTQKAQGRRHTLVDMHQHRRHAHRALWSHQTGATLATAKSRALIMHHRSHRAAQSTTELRPQPVTPGIMPRGLSCHIYCGTITCRLLTAKRSESTASVALGKHLDWLVPSTARTKTNTQIHGISHPKAVCEVSCSCCRWCQHPVLHCSHNGLPVGVHPAHTLGVAVCTRGKALDAILLGKRTAGRYEEERQGRGRRWSARCRKRECFQA